MSATVMYDTIIHSEMSATVMYDILLIIMHLSKVFVNITPIDHFQAIMTITSLNWGTFIEI
jgi:hypothetical protein